MSLTARLTAALVVLLALAASHWRAYTTGQQHQANAQAALQLQAQQQQAQRLLRQVDNQLDAQHARTQAETRIGRDRLAARTELERLRHDLARARATATAPGACGSNPDPRDQLLAAMAADIAELAQQGERIATAADGHAADALMCWATQPSATPTTHPAPHQED